MKSHSKSLKEKIIAKMLSKDDRRTMTLYVRVKPINKKYLEKEARKAGVSLTEYTDTILDTARGA